MLHKVIFPDYGYSVVFRLSVLFLKLAFKIREYDENREESTNYLITGR